MTASDAKSQVYYEKMDAISLWMSHHRLSRELRHRIRIHFRQHYTARTALNEKDILENLSPVLADDVTSCLLADVVRAHPLFSLLPEGTLWKILYICKRENAHAGDLVVGRDQLTTSLFILEHGQADLHIDVLIDVVTEGTGDLAPKLPAARATRVCRSYVIGPASSFGELAVLGICHHNKSLVNVVARTRCTLCRIQQDALLDAFRSMPGVLAKMRAAAAPDGCRIVHP